MAAARYGGNPHDFKGKIGLADLDEMIEQITVDAYGDHEQLWAFVY